MVDEKKKETKDLSWWEVSFIFLIGFVIGAFIIAGHGLTLRSNELEKAYQTNLTDWEFRYKEEKNIYLGTDFELIFDDEPYTVKLYVDWVRKVIYIEVFKMERLNYD